jgi:PAS domain S-box-containing protein
MLFDAVPDMGAIVDGSGVILRVNAAWRNCGLCPDAGPVGGQIGSNYLEVCHCIGVNLQHDLNVADELLRVLRGEQERFETDFECRCTERRTWFRLQIAPVPLAGEGRGALVLFRDITGFIQNAAQLNQALQYAGVVAFRWDLESGRVEYSENVWQTLGTSVDNRDAAIRLIHPDDYEAHLKLIEEALVQGRDFATVFRIIRPDTGEVRYLEERGQVELHEGQPVALSGVLEDCTERRETQQKLEANEAQLALALEAADCGIWEWDLDTNRVQWNERHFALLGYTPFEFEPSLEIWAERVHPDDRAATHAALEQAKQSGTRFNLEFRVVWRDGAEHWMRSVGRVFNTADGRRCAAGIMQNIDAERQLEEQMQLQSVALESSPTGMMIFDRQGLVKWVNPALCELLDCTPQALLGRLPTPLIPNELLEYVILPQLKNGHAWKGEIVIHPVTGEQRLVRQELRPMLDGKGNITHGIGLTADIEHEHEREQLFEAYFEKSQSMKFVKDLDLRYLLVNQKLTEHFGRTEEELLGQRLSDLVDGDEIREIEEREAEALRTGNECHFEISLNRPDGKHRYIKTLFPLRHADGVIYALGGMMLDVTEQKRLAEELLFSQKQEGIGRLAGGVAHDFNNLLSVIMGFSEMILMDGASLPLAVQERVQEIRRAGERASMLTRQLLTFARRQTVVPRVVDVGETISNLMKMLQRMLGENVIVETDFADDCWRVKADVAQLEQVMMNLAVNARDAMPRGGILRIEVHNLPLDEEAARAYRRLQPGDYVRIRVKDTGEGIPDELLERIFEPFFTTKQAGQGTGLGLAMCYGIVTAAGGAIWAANEADGGTSITLCLPRCLEERAHQDDHAPRPTEEGRHERVLLVEDEPAVRNLLRKVLVRQGYEVIHASHGEEALKLARNMDRMPDLLLTDVIMPGMNGRELAERLLTVWPDLKVLFMSGYSDEIIGPMDIAQRNMSFVPKPVTPAILGAVVRELLDAVE